MTSGADGEDGAFDPFPDPDEDRAHAGSAGSTLGPERVEAYLHSLRAVADADQDEQSLGCAVSVGLRWPEPQLLQQTRTLRLHQVTEFDLDGVGAAQAAVLAEALVDDALLWWEVASHDEELTTSTGLRWALRQAGVRLIGETEPLAWLEATPLMRSLRARSARAPD